jgi:hypothetical protein
VFVCVGGPYVGDMGASGRLSVRKRVGPCMKVEVVDVVFRGLGAVFLGIG